LSTISDEQIQGGADLKAALMLMKYIFHPNLRDYVPELFRILKAARNQPDFLLFFEAFMLYLLHYLDQDYHEEVEKRIQIELPEEGERIMPSVADKLKQIGREEGREEGWEEGQLSLISRLLQRKFGVIDPSLSAQLHQLSIVQVEELADVLFEWNDLNDFKAWLQQKLS
jgi:hypothetical protein